MLNIYGCEAPHEPAWIAGDREGLENLKKAIEQALEHGSGARAEYDSSGEGFDVLVLIDPGLQTREPPYRDRIFNSVDSEPWEEIAEAWKSRHLSKPENKPH